MTAQRRAHIRLLLVRNKLAFAGLLLVVLIAALSLLAPVLPIADPDKVNLSARLLGVFSEGHWLGTDHLGRDMLSRILWGTRVSLAVGASATLAAAVIGSLIGLFAGYFGRRTDTLLMRGIDMLMAFPYLLLALLIVAILGTGLMKALIAIAIVNIPFFARTVRGVTLGVSKKEFVLAARMSGFSEPKVLFREVLPNVMPTIVITMTTTLGWMILETAGLSFLGLGAQPPQADLGSMLGEGRKVFIVAPHVATVPGMVMLLLVIGINLLGDGIRDWLDPRLKSGQLQRPAALTEVNKAFQSSKEISDKPPNDINKDKVLRVDGLCTFFHVGSEVYKAANEVSFSLRPGECLGIVGESGSGKSVTALSIMQLVPSPPGRIEKGSVRFNGREVLGSGLRAFQELRGKHVSYIFQDPLTALDPLFTIGEQLREVIRAHSEPLTPAEADLRAVQLLREVNIPDPETRLAAYPHQLSGGQQQRVSIAMAIANDPDVLVADEPTTALDVTTQAEVLALLKRLQQKRNLCIILITHDMGVVAELCNRVVVMYAGQVVEMADAKSLFDAPKHPYTERLLECSPKLGEQLERLVTIPGVPPNLSQLPKHCYFSDRCHMASEECLTAPIPLETEDDGMRWFRCIKARKV